MRFPDLVPEGVCKAPCDVTIYSQDIDSDGAPVVIFSGALKCNYQERSARSFTEKGVVISNVGIAYFHGDPFPDVPISAGTLKINGVIHNIKSGSKGRNIDGTVNYSKLEVV